MRFFFNLGVEVSEHFLLTLSQTTNFKLFQSKSLQLTISNMMKMIESSQNREKTLGKKEKLLVMSNFSFSHSAFKRLVPQTYIKTRACLGKGELSDHRVLYVRVLVMCVCVSSMSLCPVRMLHVADR